MKNFKVPLLSTLTVIGTSFVALQAEPSYPEFPKEHSDITGSEFIPSYPEGYNPRGYSYQDPNSNIAAATMQKIATEKETDRMLAQKVRNALAENREFSEMIDNFKITAHEGKVTIRGTVDTETEKVKIGNAAKQINGVKLINNQLHVVKKP